jgi:ABC-type phosphate transport system auxiliary subunit
MNKFCADSAATESRIEALELEKSKLQVEMATLQSKLEMQQQHSGGLGAAMLQERLEAQQRRIAALELAKKVSVMQSSQCAALNIPFYMFCACV